MAIVASWPVFISCSKGFFSAALADDDASDIVSRPDNALNKSEDRLPIAGHWAHNHTLPV
jgi:hypothetical protein